MTVSLGARMLRMMSNDREMLKNNLPEPGGTTAGPKAQTLAKDKPQLASRSEFANLDNYILGSSAAIITNVSLIVGLGSAHSGKGPILGGLLTIALADNISDSLGIHLYKESEGSGERLSSLATVLNFLSRLLVSFSFVAIVVMLPTSQAILIGIVWALLLLTFISYLITRRNHENSVLEIIKHVLVAVIVIGLSHVVGNLIAAHYPVVARGARPLCSVCRVCFAASLPIHGLFTNGLLNERRPSAILTRVAATVTPETWRLWGRNSLNGCHNLPVAMRRQ